MSMAEETELQDRECLFSMLLSGPIDHEPSWVEAIGWPLWCVGLTLHAFNTA